MGGWTLNTVVANGLVIGAIYGLVALGITLVYKKSGVLNFAHGEVGMVGAFAFYVAFVEHHLPYLVAALIGIAVSAGLGCVTFLLLLRRRNDPLNMLIGTLAVGGALDLPGQRDLGARPALRAAAADRDEPPHRRSAFRRPPTARAR